MKLTDIRRARLRELMEKKGTKNLSETLGYRQPSFLSQMAGPNPTRDISEKTARRFEQKLGLPTGYLDMETDPVEAPVRAASAPVAGSVAQVAEVIRMVGSICAGENVELAPIKFADVVALAYVDMMEHAGTARPEHIKQIVRLLK